MKKELKSGIIYAPYISMESTDGPRKEYEKFMKKYNTEHAACPKCSSVLHSTTLVGYILNLDNPDNYKDENICVCQVCRDRHIAHDRVPSVDKIKQIIK